LYPKCVIYFSLTSVCGGRNDLSRYFPQAQSSNQTTRDFQARSLDDNDSLYDIDWDSLASDLLSYNESAMCSESYTTGSGNIMRVQMVNRSCRCVLFDQVFNSNDILAQFAVLLRPLLYGKIYYHPSNIPYDNLIKQINQTFESLDELVRLCRQIELTIQPTYDILKSFCDVFSDSSPLCQQLPMYKTTFDLFIIATEFIACSERNRFIPMNSEVDMVREGQNQSVANNFLAAIEFLDDLSNNDSLPKHVRYKIRMTLDYVDNTFQTQDR
jgi:hypothetical protein